MSTEEWRKQNTMRLNLRIANSTGIPDALRRMQGETGEKPIEYAKRALTESLEFDGYLDREPVHPADRKK